jgi:16S rRNA (guanine527-N7)-methyltransferase
VTSTLFHVKQTDIEWLRRLDVSRETITRLEAYVALLLRWSPTIRLISRGDEDRIWQRHVLDSLQIIPLLRSLVPPAGDFGSGAGFPGLILSIALGWPWHLVESDGRKVAFLLEAARLTGAMVIVHRSRVEMTSLPPLKIITARGFASLTALLSHAADKLAPEGVCFFYKGQSAASELTQARHQWHMDVTCHQSLTNPSGVILQISGVTRARSLPLSNI